MMEKDGEGSAVPADPVRSFEQWKKRYSRTKARVKRERVSGRKRPEWQVERDYISQLVSRYPGIEPDSAVKFSDFPISKKTLLGLQQNRFRQPTRVQRQTLAPALQGRDVLAAARTGSGKTLAFVVPLLEALYRRQWAPEDGLGALVLAPTRELAYQTFTLLRQVGCNHDLSAALLVGGTDVQAESERISRTNIVVCTPGRLLQHMDQSPGFTASGLQLLVLDEADRILDLGFADTLNAIVENLPRSRQTLLFSATQTRSVEQLARLSLRDPEYVWVHETARFPTPATLEQAYLVCELHHKVNTLYSFIRSHLSKKVIVFFACCKEVQYLFRCFCRLRPGIPVLALHGKQPQMKRVEVYRDFSRKQKAVLFATDVAARGLDFPAVNWVLQYDCPEDADTYIHRVGRTARYKEGGEALLLLLPSEEKAMVAQLEGKKVPITKIQVNPEKVQSVEQKLQAFLAQEKEQKERAQRCFMSYLRSVYLMKNKDVFDVCKLQLQPFALSLGLAVAPRVRFLSKVQRAEGEQEEEQEQELSDFKAQLKGRSRAEEQESSESEDGSGSETDQKESRTILGGAGDSDEEDLRDLDLLTVKRRDVFNLAGEQDSGEGAEDGEQQPAEKKTTTTEKETKYKEAKKILKRKFQVNTKVGFTEEGEAVQLWPPAQRVVAGGEEEEEEEEEEGVSGINVDRARERLKREDQEFDKQEYSRRVKAKHREKRLKEREARREASRRGGRGPGESDDEEDEVVAYLANHSEDEFDPSTLPDPDRPHAPSSSSEEEEEEEEDEVTPPGKRQRSAAGSRGEEQDLIATKKKKKTTPQLEEEHAVLDTGLSLAEDEELVLQLLGGR
ncbi:probable ATP-dependent RNA helicase DDX10 [Cololabis saira]|uniref:probable ATP-dependent RNA helicase DDX10 n=1 Tax=Cololabis saira TaxID=129043 RepID=UPI002AD56D14|nr:probable ATP-dependent RNA helicase DDX10 [Cololabis saira]